MPLVGIATAFLGAILADLKGSEVTRPFTRKAFVVLVLLEGGATVDGVVAGLSSIMSVIV